MRTFEFSRHNVLIATEDCSSLDIPDAMKCRAHYTILRSRGRIRARIHRVEQETKGEWVSDWLPRAECSALESHIERLCDEDDAEDARNVREVAEGFT